MSFSATSCTLYGMLGAGPVLQAVLYGMLGAGLVLQAVLYGMLGAGLVLQAVLYGMLGAGPMLQAVLYGMLGAGPMLQAVLYGMLGAGPVLQAVLYGMLGAGPVLQAVLYGMLGAGPVVLRASCGTSTPASFDTSDSYAFVRFVSNSNSQSTGFSLNFQSSIEGKCCQRRHQQTLRSAVTVPTSLMVECSCLSSRGQCM